MTQHTSNPNIPTPSQFGPYQGTPPPPQKNGIGLAALIVAIVGFLFACIPGALIIGWVLLPVAFILSIVGLTRSGRKKGTSIRSEEHTSELQSRGHLVCRLLLEKKKKEY